MEVKAETRRALEETPAGVAVWAAGRAIGVSLPNARHSTAIPSAAEPLSPPLVPHQQAFPLASLPQL